MDSDELFLLEALVAVLPYVVVKSGEWLEKRLGRLPLRRGGANIGANAPL